MNKRIITLLIATALLTGCVTSKGVEKLQDFSPKSKTLILTNPSVFDSKIRVALAKKGFKVLKYASIKKIISKGNETDIAQIYNKAEARYGLTFYWEQVDRCIGASGKLVDGTFEISDLRTNEVLMVVEGGGWTGNCVDIFAYGNVFDNLAGSLSESWMK